MWDKCALYVSGFVLTLTALTQGWITNANSAERQKEAKRVSQTYTPDAAFNFPFGITAAITSDDNGQVDPDPTRYLFYPDSPIHLGAGLSPNNVTTPKGDCVNADQYDIDNGAALQTFFTKTLVTNPDQLKQALSIDAKLDASYLTYNGGAHYSYNSKSMFSSDSLTLVLTASSTYSRRGVRNSKLTDLGKRWVTDGAKFAEYCGTRFVSVEYNGSATSIIITISNVSSEDHSSISTALSAQGGWGPMTGTASAKFDGELSRNNARGEVDIQVVSTGGNGLAALGTLLQNMATAGSLTSIQAIENAMGSYLTTFTNSNAAPVAYDVESMGYFGWNENTADLWTEQEERNLRTIVSAYRELAAKQDTINAVLSGSDVRRNLLSSADIARLPVIRKAYEDFMQTLATADKSCLANVAVPCAVPVTPSFPQNPIPDLPPAPSGYMGISIAADGDDVESKPETVWDPIQSRATLAGINPLSKGLIHGQQPPLDWPSVKIPSIIGQRATLWYFVTGQTLQDTMQVSFREDGSQDYVDLFRVYNSCSAAFRPLNALQNLPPQYTVCIVVGGFHSHAFTTAGPTWEDASDSVMSYIFKAAAPVLGAPEFCNNKSQHSGEFFLHLFDNFGRESYLPLFRGSWNLDQFWAQGGCYYANDSLELDLVD